MKKFGLAAISSSAIASAALCAAMCIPLSGMLAAVPAHAQAAPAADSAKIHGHAQNPLAEPIANTKVEITTDGKTPLYTFTTDANGDYTGSGIKPGTYTVVLYGTITGKDGKPAQGIIDYQQNIKLTAGADEAVNFDLTRQSYVSKLPPDEQKKIAEVRKQNAGVEKANAQIKNVNKLITQARADRKAGNFDQAIALDTQATQAKPDVGLTWYELGDSNLAAKKYDAAVTAYQKALQVMSTEKAPKPEVLAAANNNLGEALAQSGKIPDAVNAYEAAAKADPANAGKYYSNEAIVLFKTGQAPGAEAAADKAIAANPNDPIPYYIKGWSLVQKATVDPKTGKIVLPPGCADAYHKFISLNPPGSNQALVADAQNILAQAGETVHSSFRKH